MFLLALLPPPLHLGLPGSALGLLVLELLLELVVKVLVERLLLLLKLLLRHEPHHSLLLHQGGPLLGSHGLRPFQGARHIGLLRIQLGLDRSLLLLKRLFHVVELQVQRVFHHPIVRIQRGLSALVLLRDVGLQ